MSNEPPSVRKDELRPVDELVVAKFLKKGISFSSFLLCFLFLTKTKGIAAEAVVSLLGKPDDEDTPSALFHQYSQVLSLTKNALQDSPHTLSLSFSLQTLLPVYYDTQQSKYRCTFYCPKPTVCLIFLSPLLSLIFTSFSLQENTQYQYIALYCPDSNGMTALTLR